MKKSDGNRVLRVPRYEKMEGKTKLLIFYDGPRKMGKVLEWHKWDGPCQIQAIIIIDLFFVITPIQWLYLIIDVTMENVFQ